MRHNAVSQRFLPRNITFFDVLILGEAFGGFSKIGLRKFTCIDFVCVFWARRCPLTFPTRIYGVNFLYHVRQSAKVQSANVCSLVPYLYRTCPLDCPNLKNGKRVKEWFEAVAKHMLKKWSNNGQR